MIDYKRMKANSYQIVVALAPKLENKVLEASLKSVSEWIEEAGGKAKKPKDLGNKPLEYEIKGNKSADFYEFSVESDLPMSIKDFNLHLNRESSIIRYLVLKN